MSLFAKKGWNYSVFEQNPTLSDFLWFLYHSMPIFYPNEKKIGVHLVEAHMPYVRKFYNDCYSRKIKMTAHLGPQKLTILWLLTSMLLLKLVCNDMFFYFLSPLGYCIFWLPLISFDLGKKWENGNQKCAKNWFHSNFQFILIDKKSVKGKIIFWFHRQKN